MRKYCAVEPCLNQRGVHKLSFFKFPDDDRYKRWKELLGFTGSHRYANLSQTECRQKFIVCSEHFSPEDFTSAKGNRLKGYSVFPSVNLGNVEDKDKAQLNESSNANEDQENINNLRNCPGQVSVEVQTDDTNKREPSTSASSPRKLVLSEEIQHLKNEVNRLKRKSINIEDISKYFKENIPPEFAALIGAQLSLLQRTARAARQLGNGPVVNDDKSYLDEKSEDSCSSRHVKYELQDGQSDITDSDETTNSTERKRKTSTEELNQPSKFLKIRETENINESHSNSDEIEQIENIELKFFDPAEQYDRSCDSFQQTLETERITVKEEPTERPEEITGNFESNEFALFGQQVGIHLNQLSLKNALEVQHKILSILTEARLGELSNGC